MKIIKIKHDLIAYAGKRYTIEWFFKKDGKSPALDYFTKLPSHNAKKLTYIMEILGDIGSLYDERKFRHEGDKIYAMKPSPYRFLCFFFDGGKIIITNAFEKKADKMPPEEKERSLRYMNDYINRCKLGKYYG